MQTPRFLFVWLPVLMLVGSLPVNCRAASVGASGYTNDFSVQPPASDWSTFSIAGAQADVTTASQVDTEVQQIAAGSIISQTAVNPNTPADATGSATWSSSGFYLQTRPTGNRITLLMCTLTNTLGVAARGVTIGYDFFSVAPNGDEIPGHNVYYSLTGAAGSWTTISALSQVTTGGRVSAELTFTWADGSPLYLLWADDNSINSPDTANQIDNFAAVATPGTQTPVAITTQPQSQAVNELQPATFTVDVIGYLPPTVQWYTNNVPVPNATNTSYAIIEAPLNFDGLQIKVIAQNVASNITYYATSAVASLTVNPDLVSPVLLGAASAGLQQVVASFSERLSPASVSNLGNYSITGPGGVTVSAATLDESGTNLILTVSTMVQNADYTLTVSGVRDRAAAGNLVTPGSQAPFKALSYTSVDIGNPAITGSASVLSGVFTATGAGTNIAGVSDQFFFYYQTVSGDFDLRTRVESLSVADLFTKAGLMARETLAANGRFAMAAATPSSAGAFLLSRSSVGGSVATSGSLPVNYPQTWLRLTRSNNVFTGYASFDGTAWALLGSVTLGSAASTFNVGLAVTSADPARSVTALFQDLGPTTGATIIPDLSLPWEPLGPASRNTGLVISEIMYHPKHSNDLEFVELFNAGLIAEDLGGYRLSGDVDYTFPDNTILPAGAFLVVARKPALLQQAYGITGVMGPWIGAETNALPDGGGTIRLRYRHHNALLLEVNYATESPWPLATDGAGHSLVLARPSYGQGDVRAWAASARIGGSPGRMETVEAEPLRNVVINEFLANSDFPAEDYIELYNHSTQSVNISGAYLSDDRDTNKFRIPNGTVLPARGFAVLTQTQLGFALSSSGERIYLVNSNQNRVIDCVAFNGQAPGVSSGRYPDGGEGIHELLTQTPGGVNSGLFIRPIVINEIMFHPPSGNSDDEFVELYNRGANVVDVSNWRFTAGIDFAFPPNTVIPAGGYLVVARKAARLFAHYTQLNSTNTVGDFSGTLANGGERLALAMPEYLVSTNGQGHLVTNINWIVMDEVPYRDSTRWARWADGGGSSLELIDPNSDNRLAANWADSDETAKSQWTNIAALGVTDNVYPVNASGATMDELQVMILGAGEALMDDLEVRAGTSAQNLVVNPSFNSGLTPWLIQGNHERSGLEPADPSNPTQCMRIRATAGGDNGANRVECDLLTPVPANTSATIAGRFRWLRGFPIVLMRLHGGGLEAVGTLPIPANLGTPGQPNSRFVGNAGPAVYDVSHSPVLPAANEAVVVTARVNDPDGIASVQLRYRLDPATSLSTLAMRDDGTSGDAVAGDGIYSARINGQASGTLVAFHVLATDTRTPAGATLFPADAPAHECLIRFGDPAIPGALGVYRLWQTASNYNRWRDRERLSNEPVDGTFVYGKIRSIYNAGARYRGSPFTRNPGSPVATGANFVWTLPDDDQFLGTDELNIDSLEPTGRDATALREVTSFKMADQLGLTFSYQRYIRPVINGTPTPSPVSTDSQQPNGEYTAMWFPGVEGGELFKVDDWFEFADTLTGSAGTGMQGNKSASLDAFNTTQPDGRIDLKQARYRWSWEKKFNNGLNDDYSSIFAAVKALTEPNPNTYPSQVESVIEAEEWLTAFALRHVIGDWDGYGYNRGKNQFIYRPDGQKIWMLLWDLDFSIGCTSGHGPTQDLFSIANGGLSASDSMPEIVRMYNHPYFRRMYLQALLRIADGPLQDSAYGPTLEARYRALLANGVSGLTSPYVASGAQGISLPAWITQRRDFMYNSAGNPNRLSLFTNFPFALTSPSTVTSSSNMITITGTAPLGVKTIQINGRDYPLTWASVTNWSIRVPISQGTTVLSIQVYDRNGHVFPSTEPTVTASFNGVPADPAESVVFNELMFDPVVPGAEYVELFNRSSNTTFDLSGWRINGLDYTFPTGSYILPRTYLVLARDAHACISAYGTNTPVFGEYSGNLQGDGETITLIKPGATPAQDLVVDRVRYESAAPWSTNATGTGSSIQLIDAQQDNSRLCNWGTRFTPAVWTTATNIPGSTNSGWRYVSITNVTGSTSTMQSNLIYLSVAGDVYLDDLSLVNTNDPAVNLLSNGDFEGPFTAVEGGPWSFFGTVATNSQIAHDVVHSGSGSLHVVFTGSGGPAGYIVQQFAVPAPTNAHILSYWYYATEAANNLSVRLRPGIGLISTTNVQIQVIPDRYFPAQIVTQAVVSLTPGRANTGASNIVPAIPPLWLNEVQAVNLNGITDNTGAREPFIELYNSGTNVESLDGMYLSDNYTNLAQWAFPAGASILPGEFKVIFADGQPGQSTATEWHTSFRLDAASTQIALSRTRSGLEILDYLNFAGLRTNWSYGSYPDGQPFYRQDFYRVTAGGTNDATAPLIEVSVNEWMAANFTTLANPVGGGFDDWFELYNRSTNAANLEGYYLTDSLTNKTQYRIPTGYVIPPLGRLLVWSDGQPGRNSTNQPDLHVNFQLNRNGEAIGLFDANGLAIDTVTFGVQGDDVSEGRCPDGGTSVTFFTNSATPRLANSCGTGANTAPVPAAIARRTVHRGQVVSVTVTADDAEVPPQTLSYSLDLAPPGATIQAGTGLFTWNTGVAAVPSTNAVVVRVTDSGVPPLSATAAFDIVVLPPPGFGSVTRNGAQVAWSWPTIPGARYQVMYKAALSDLNWVPMGPVQTGTGAPLTLTIDTSSGKSGFYQVVVTN